jgi:hypothetical protein
MAISQTEDTITGGIERGDDNLFQRAARTPISKHSFVFSSIKLECNDTAPCGIDPEPICVGWIQLNKNRRLPSALAYSRERHGSPRCSWDINMPHLTSTLPRANSETGRQEPHGARGFPNRKHVNELEGGSCTYRPTIMLKIIPSTKIWLKTL